MVSRHVEHYIEVGPRVWKFEGRAGTRDARTRGYEDGKLGRLGQESSLDSCSDRLTSKEFRQEEEQQIRACSTQQEDSKLLAVSEFSQ